MRRQIAYLGLVCGFAGSLGSAILPSPAWAASSIAVNSGRLGGGTGDSALVDVTYSCDADDDVATIQVDMVQGSHSIPTSGSGTSSNVVCNGQPQNASITVFARSGGGWQPNQYATATPYLLKEDTRIVAWGDAKSIKL